MRRQGEKGMEMSMNVIIMAVIALLILVILVFLIGTKTELFNRGTKCVEAGGRCRSYADCAASGHGTIPGEPAEACGSDSVCCKVVPS